MIGPALSYAGEGEKMSKALNMIDVANSEGIWRTSETYRRIIIEGTAFKFFIKIH